MAPGTSAKHSQMHPPIADAARIDVSSTDVPARFRLSGEVGESYESADGMREVFGRNIFRVNFASVDRPSFNMHLRLRTMPGLKLGSGPMRGAIVRRARELIDDGNDEVVMLADPRGCMIVRQRGREADIRAGGACISMNAEPYTLFQVKTDAVRIAVPRLALKPFVPDLEDRVATALPADNEALRLLSGYVKLLDDAQLSNGSDITRHVATHVHDLMALAIGAGRDAGAFAAGRGLRAARLHAIKADISGRIGARPVTAEDVAGRHGISLRYLRKLFEAEGTSFSAYVVEQHLLRARQMLTAPRYAASAISAIAYAVGFSDLSYFNRAFRRRFGGSPSEVRARELG